LEGKIKKKISMDVCNIFEKQNEKEREENIV